MIFLRHLNRRGLPIQRHRRLAVHLRGIAKRGKRLERYLRPIELSVSRIRCLEYPHTETRRCSLPTDGNRAGSRKGRPIAIGDLVEYPGNIQSIVLFLGNLDVIHPDGHRHLPGHGLSNLLDPKGNPM